MTLRQGVRFVATRTPDELPVRTSAFVALSRDQFLSRHSMRPEELLRQDGTAAIRSAPPRIPSLQVLMRS